MKQICIGMAGAGRAAELHINALRRVAGVPLRLKTITARRAEQLLPAQRLFGFENASYDFNDLCQDPQIDVVDICTPPYAHENMIIKAIKAGKHVICEKPLTGYFSPKSSTGKNITSKKVMYETLLESLQKLKEIIKASNCKFMYAENFVYAPSIVKAAEIIASKKSRILYMKGEESLNGSSSASAGEWGKTGGGTFIRTGVHPLSAMLYLKQQEALALNRSITLKSVMADMGTVTASLSEYERRYLNAKPIDVEDNGTAIFTFSDNSKAVVIATDCLLGGSKNNIEIYCNNAVIRCCLTMNNAMSLYLANDEGLDGIVFSETQKSKVGWSRPLVADETIRGYAAEMQDFIDSVYYDKKPKSGFQLAFDTVKASYAAYMSSELGTRVEL